MSTATPDAVPRLTPVHPRVGDLPTKFWAAKFGAARFGAARFGAAGFGATTPAAG